LKVKGSDKSTSNSPETDWVVPVGWLSPVAAGGDEVGPSAAVATVGWSGGGRGAYPLSHTRTYGS
jgi:hypothetical protein